jgi:molybdenum cofactor biosynthesis protein B
MGYREHRRQGPGAVPCAIVTASDTRDEASDRSGALIRRALLKAGHPVVDYRVLKDDPERIASHLRALAARGDVRAILVNGGTGIAPRDRTYEAVAALLETRLDGFGELFRALSFRAIGPSAMLSRAVAGTFRGMIVFSMPGSEDAVRLALRRLILPELAHVAGLLARGEG